MNTLKLLTIFATAAVLAALEFNQRKYTQFEKTEGSATVGIQEALITVSLIQCGLQCLSDPTCNGYSTMDREEGGYYCLKTACPAELPSGTWTTYSENGATEACIETKINILHREDGSVNFERVWADYKAGFGDPNGELWLGLDKQHQLTTEHSYGLNVTMKAWDGKSFWAYYSMFSVGPESDNYRLSVSGYDVSSTAPDKLSYHNNMEFSTKDRDNDRWAGDCSAGLKGGWWYQACAICNPTGLYLEGGVEDMQGITWHSVPGYSSSYSFKEMTYTLIRQ